MSTACKTTNSTSPRDPSKMSKGELLRLYKTAVAEKEDLAGKYGKVQKKYKHAKKALTAGWDSNKPTKKEKIPYPTGETPGRGSFNLSTFLSESSGVSKENYNSFIESIHKAMAAAGIPTTATWRNIQAGPLSDVLDVIREQYPWLRRYVNDWPATTVMKQFLRNSRNSSRRKAHKAAACAAATATAVD